jgi:hypothetical protein
MTNPLLKIGILVGIITAVAAGAFTIKLMYDMTSYMGEMASYVRHISVDMSAMHDKMGILTGEISKIDDVVEHMDSNMNAMNVDINVIQQAMSQEMGRIRVGVGAISEHLATLDQNMALITSEVSKLDDIMGFMSSDIHRSTQSFTSPMNYMWNMMR